jgi:hypothetical protein
MAEKEKPDDGLQEMSRNPRPSPEASLENTKQIVITGDGKPHVASRNDPPQAMPNMETQRKADPTSGRPIPPPPPPAPKNQDRK